jgi:hypothetical protein
LGQGIVRDALLGEDVSPKELVAHERCDDQRHARPQGSGRRAGTAMMDN